jgi:branched-chain amino acid transport system ATP-binding protein
MSEPLLRVASLHAGYGAVQVLRGVSLAVNEAEIVTLIGANGAGKSTTLMTICGMVAAADGEIVFNGESIRGVAPEKIAARGVCQAPEGRRIFADFTVLENLEMGAFMRRDRRQIKRDVDYVFGLFPALAPRRRQHGGTLSGGEQQMLAISRALMARPRLLLLDEPSLGLAPMIVRRIFQVIARINREQKTAILLVEQNANLALKCARRGYVMEHGTIALADDAARLLQNPQIQKAYLGGG